MTSSQRPPSDRAPRSAFGEYQEELRKSGLTSRERTDASMSLIIKLSLMSFRGARLRPFLGAAASTPFVGRGVRVRGAKQLSIGRRVLIEDFAEIQASSHSGVRLGDGVSIGSMTMIRPSGYYGRLGEGLTIGNRTGIGPYCYFGCSGGITIGADVLMGPGVMIFSENHNFSEATLSIKEQGVLWAPTVIEDDCWVGSGVRVTGGVRIGRGSVIGAGSVVTHDIQAWSVAVGNPARVIRSRMASGGVD